MVQSALPFGLPQVRNLKDGTFDPRNPLHVYCGRWKTIQWEGKTVTLHEVGQPDMGNPFKIGRDGDRSEVVEKYRKHLWKQIQQRPPTLLQFLHSLTEDHVLYCHCSPLPCHCDVIARASRYVQENIPLVEPPPQPTSHPRPADWKLAFGVFKGCTLEEAFEENPGYLDWLASQDWLYPSTRRAVIAFVSLPQVAAEIDRRYFDFDTRCGGRFATDHVFIPSHQTTPKFSRGKPEWLRPDWSREESPLAKLLFLRPMQAWELAADLLQAIEDCETIEQLDIIEENDRIEQLQDALPGPVMKRLRDAYREKAKQLSLLALLPPQKRENALLALEAITQKPELEPILQEQDPQLYDTVELLRLC